MVRILLMLAVLLQMVSVAYASVYVFDVKGDALYFEGGVTRFLVKGMKLAADVKVEVKKGALIRYVAPSGPHGASKKLKKHGYYLGPLVHQTVASNTSMRKQVQAGATRGEEEKKETSGVLQYVPMKKFPQLNASIPFLPIDGIEPQNVTVYMIKGGKTVNKVVLTEGIPAKLAAGQYEFQFWADGYLLYKDDVTVVPFDEYKQQVSVVLNKADFPNVSRHNLLIYSMYNAGYIYFGELLRRGYVNPKDIVAHGQSSEDYNFELYLKNLSESVMKNVSDAH